MARIKNPLTLIKGGGGYGEYNIDQVIDGEDCELIISQAKEPEPVVEGYQPNADMKAMKKICEDDVQEGFTYKVLQMISDGYVYTDIVVPSGGAVKTSDGQYYTQNAKHTWDTSKDIKPKYYQNMKLRWLIYYYPTETSSITLLNDVMYACFDAIKFYKRFSGEIFKKKTMLQYFDIINGANINPNETSLNYIFYECSSLQSIPLIDTSNVTDFSSMFASCSSLQTIPLINTSKGTDFSYMFSSCSSLQSIPLINTSKATRLSSMFAYCSSLQTIPSIDTSNATDFNYMFRECEILQTIPLINTSKGTDFSHMFTSCSSLQSIPLINTSNGKTNSMFYYCVSLQKIQLIDMLKTTSASPIFIGCSYLEFIKLINVSISLSLASSTKYSRDTIVNDIFSGLVDLTGQTAQTLTLGAENLAKLSEEDKALATNKGWILA